MQLTLSEVLRRYTTLLLSLTLYTAQVRLSLHCLLNALHTVPQRTPSAVEQVLTVRRSQKDMAGLQVCCCEC